MATTAKAYGQITIIDVSDLGTLSVVPESTQPTSIIYDPNKIDGTNTGYNPDWTKTNLVLTPVIYYTGEEKSPTANGMSVTWQKRIGADANTQNVESSKGEIIENGKLIVTKNVMTETNPIITYICTVNYLEPKSGQTLVAKGQISFSLTIQPTRVKTCTITGETVFKYLQDQTLGSNRTIKLEANAINCSITGWYYKDGSGNFQPIKRNGELVAGKELVIDAVDNDSYFFNRTATFKVVTSDDQTYDIHTITKLYDGTAGTSTLSVVLTNEDIWIPCGQDGTPTTNAFDNVTTKIIVYDGTEDITSKATITTETSAVVGSFSRSDSTYTVTGVSADVGSVTFTVKYGDRTVNRVFNLTKLRAGADGNTPEIYSVHINPLAITLDKNGSFGEQKITISAEKTSTERVPYAGRFVITGMIGSSESEEVYRSTSDESSYTYTPVSKVYTGYLVKLFNASSGTKLLDSQTCTVVRDGVDGDNTITLSLSNDSDSVVTTKGVAGAFSIVTQATVMDGSAALTAAVDLESVPTGFVKNTHYSYSNNKLEIFKLPTFSDGTEFKGGEFTFSYQISESGPKIYKKFTLRVLNEDYLIHLAVSPTVINAKSNGSIAVTAKDSKGVVYTQNTGSGSDEVALYVDNKKVSSGSTGWSIPYSAGRSAPINIELRKGTTVYDSEVVEFVKDGKDALLLALDNDSDRVSIDSNGQRLGLPVNIAAKLYSGEDQLSGKNVTLEAPAEFKTNGALNTSYATYSNNTLRITDVPNGIKNYEFTFSYTENGATLTKKYKLNVESSEVNYQLIVSKTAINSATSGKVTVTVKKHAADGISILSAPGDDTNIGIYKNGSATALTNWTINYAAGETSSINLVLKQGSSKETVDQETIEFVKDGAQGVGGLSILLSNNTDQIPCSSDGITQAHTIKIPFAAYKGITRIACEATIPASLPSGMTGKVEKLATTEEDGLITLTIAKDKNLGGNVSGIVEFTLAADGVSVIRPFTWTKNLQGVDGANGEAAVVLRAFAPGGNIVNQNEEYVDLSYTLTKGSESITPNSYTWAYYDFGVDAEGNVKGYQTIVGDYNKVYIVQENGDLRVYKNGIDSYGSFRISVKYGESGAEKTYEDYISVQDKTDPLQVEIFSTLGDKITNSVGVGCIYARLFQNGVELDDLQHLQVSIDQPANPQSLDIWAKIDSDAKEIVLFKYVNNNWQPYSQTLSHNYIWTFADYDGRATNLNGSNKKVTKFLYIEGSLINRKMQFNLEVTSV